MDRWDDDARVDRMVAAGVTVMAEAIKVYQPVAVVAAFSGGGDSIVATHFASVNGPGCGVFNADTLVGLSPVRRHIEAVAARYGWDMEVGKADAEGPPEKMLDKKAKRFVPFDPASLPAGRWADGASAYEEQALNRGFFGRGKKQHARMYQRLKERPIRRMLKRLGASKAGKKVLIISGVRHDESDIRAGYKRAFAEGESGDVWVNPFYWQTAADFAAYRDEFGLPENPAKRTCGVSGECCCGTFRAPGERAAYAKLDPAFDAYLTGLERRVRGNGFPWGWGESPPKWWTDRRRGQAFLFDPEPPAFTPMCVGCERKGGAA